MGLDYSIQYKKGKENVAADALSRCHEKGSLVAITTLVLEWCQEIITSYEGDEKVKALLEKVVVSREERDEYSLVGGMLRYQGRLVVGNNGELKRRIIQSLHESAIRGHLGAQNTYLRVKQLFFWPELKTEVKEFVTTCDICKWCKSETMAYPSLL